MFVLDALKGAIAAVGLWLGGRAGGYVLGAAIVGHIFPVTRGFRGGKGVATGAGVLGVLHPIVAAVVAALWLGLSRLTGKAAVASIAAVVATPIGLALSGAPAWEFAATVGRVRPVGRPPRRQRPADAAPREAREHHTTLPQIALTGPRRRDFRLLTHAQLAAARPGRRTGRTSRGRRRPAGRRRAQVQPGAPVAHGRNDTIGRVNS